MPVVERAGVGVGRLVNAVAGQRIVADGDLCFARGIGVVEEFDRRRNARLEHVAVGTDQAGHGVALLGHSENVIEEIDVDVAVGRIGMPFKVDAGRRAAQPGHDVDAVVEYVDVGGVAEEAQRALLGQVADALRVVVTDVVVDIDPTGRLAAERTDLHRRSAVVIGQVEGDLAVLRILIDVNGRGVGVGVGIHAGDLVVKHREVAAVVNADTRRAAHLVFTRLETAAAAGTLDGVVLDVKVGAAGDADGLHLRLIVGVTVHIGDGVVADVYVVKLLGLAAVEGALADDEDAVLRHLVDVATGDVDAVIAGRVGIGNYLDTAEGVGDADVVDGDPAEFGFFVVARRQHDGPTVVAGHKVAGAVVGTRRAFKLQVVDVGVLGVPALQNGRRCRRAALVRRPLVGQRGHTRAVTGDLHRRVG